MEISATLGKALSAAALLLILIGLPNSASGQG
jgi:hypothetical protein